MPCWSLGDDLPSHFAVDVRQSKIAARILVRQLFVVDPHQVQNRGVQVVDRHPVLYGIVAEFIGFSIAKTGFDAAARHPHREPLGVMVAADDLRVARLGSWCAAKLAPPQDQRIFQQPPRLEVLDQAGDRFVDLADVDLVSLFQVGVLVPLFVVKRQAVGVTDLDKTDAPLGKAASQQTHLAKVLGLLVVQSVQLPRVGRFAGQVDRLGCGRLHAEGHLVRFDPRCQVGVAPLLLLVLPIELLQEVELPPLLLAGGELAFQESELGILGQGIRVARLSQWDTLVDRWQEGVTKVVDAPMQAGGTDRDKVGQVLVLTAQAVTDPGSHARPQLRIAAGEQFHAGAAVGHVGVTDTVQHAEFVRHFRQVLPQLAHRQAVLTGRSEFPGRSEQVAPRGELDASPFKWWFFPVPLGQFRFRVEQVDMRRSAMHEQEDDPLGRGREVGPGAFLRPIVTGEGLFGQQLVERQPAKSDTPSIE